MTGRITIVTGTDTGVGKTVLSGLLVYCLRCAGVDAVALKPFCSGSRTDARHLRKMQGSVLSLDAINPFYFSEPLAPMVAARKHRRKISFERVVHHIRSHQTQREHVIVEGAGGLLTPLGEGFSILDISRELQSDLIIVAANKLGVINHTLLTVRAAGENAQVVLMRQEKEDASAASNVAILLKLLAPVPVYDFPYLRAYKRKPHRDAV